MFVTNDVALIVFVPFTVALLSQLGLTKSVVPIILLSNTNDHALADENSSKIIDIIKEDTKEENDFFTSSYEFNKNDFAVDEDFEDYTKDVNWINADNSSSTSTSAVSLTNFNVKDAKDNEKAWIIQRQWRSKVVPAEQPYNNDEFVGVVDAPEGAEGMSGKVLKIYNNRGTRYNYDYTVVRRNFNKLSGIKFTDEKYKGKKLVYEVDVYSPQYTDKTIFGI